MATIDVKDAAGSTVAIEKPLVPGRAADTASRPIALSNEDKTALDAVTTAITASILALGRAATSSSLCVVDANDRVVTITFTPSQDTAGTNANDVLFATEALANVGLVNGANVVLETVFVSDIDNVGDAQELIFFNANTTLGTEDAAPDIDDTEVLTVVGKVQIGSADWTDLGVNRVAMLNNLGVRMRLGAATTSLWVAGITRASTTHTASGQQFQFTFRRE